LRNPAAVLLALERLATDQIVLVRCVVVHMNLSKPLLNGVTYIPNIRHGQVTQAVV
jgi:hypothetical protein